MLQQILEFLVLHPNWTMDGKTQLIKVVGYLENFEDVSYVLFDTSKSEIPIAQRFALKDVKEVQLNFRNQMYRITFVKPKGEQQA